jgi:hypothetical protein
MVLAGAEDVVLAGVLPKEEVVAHTYNSDLDGCSNKDLVYGICSSTETEPVDECRAINDIVRINSRNGVSYSKKTHPGVVVFLLMYLLFSFSSSLGRVAV